MRLHVVGLPHTETTDEFSWCAYSQKVRNFCNMMMKSGHEVFLYAGTNNQADCTELISITGQLSAEGSIPEFSSTNPRFQSFNRRAIKAIKERIEDKDFICIIGGDAQQQVSDEFPNHMAVEYGVGYGGIYSRFRVFESYAWMHTVYAARTANAHGTNGQFYDAVIPNYFNTEQFPKGEGKGDYLLYVGRLIERKGVQIALETAERAGMKLIVAGSGEYPLTGDVEYRGVIQPKERAELMGAATAILTPTLYIEPFGGVAVEAQLCGTPAITTDFGAFTETVEDGATGFRCHTLKEFTEAVEKCKDVNRNYIRARAFEKYSLEAVRPQYDAYFERLMTLWGEGFYAK